MENKNYRFNPYLVTLTLLKPNLMKEYIEIQ